MTPAEVATDVYETSPWPVEQVLDADFWSEIARDGA
jgi:hypothetical protein